MPRHTNNNNRYENVGYSALGSNIFVNDGDDENDENDDLSTAVTSTLKNLQTTSSTCDTMTLGITVITFLFLAAMFILIKFNTLYNNQRPSFCTVVPELNSAGLKTTTSNSVSTNLVKNFEAKFDSIGRLIISDTTSGILRKKIAVMKSRRLFSVPTRIDLMDMEMGGYTVANYRDISMVPVYRCGGGGGGGGQNLEKNLGSPLGYVSGTFSSQLSRAQFGDTVQFLVYNSRRELVARTNKIRVKNTAIHTFVGGDARNEPLEFTLQDVSQQSTSDIDEKSLTEQQASAIVLFSRGNSKVHEKATWQVTVKGRAQTDDSLPIGTFAMYIVALADFYHFV